VVAGGAALTVPVGVPLGDVTAARKVKDWP
jgi:hypothetical protein